MKLLFAIMAVLNWYYIPYESPSSPVEVEGVEVNLKRNELAFTFFSLSDGEAALIQHGNGENILLNTGGEDTFHELERLLSLFRVSSISSVLITSRDGLSNLEQVIRKYKVGNILVGKSVQNLIKADLPAEIKSWKQGDIEEILPSLIAELVYEGGEEKEGSDISFQFFHQHIFYISSASRKAEQQFLSRPLKNVNIVKLPQYGERDSFSDLLIEHLDPQLAILFHSNEIKPDPDLLEMLHEAWIDVYSTRQHGTVTIKFTDSNYDVITILSEE
ncbi:ATP-dependent DNA helicase [Bacillus sp. REN3]|uniref:ATP-dependent DNA helicase n=1 Tax=Bacillus sp. REN3 TaxID=2802440 RepID=UPI001AED48B9|nr:ATP-dependent DNA helicase [Bacillus sp. REN3]